MWYPTVDLKINSKDSLPQTLPNILYKENSWFCQDLCSWSWCVPNKPTATTPRFSACFPSPNRNFRTVYSKQQELVPFSEFRDACHICVLLSDSLRRDIGSTQLTLPPQMEPKIFARNTAFSWLRIETYSKPSHRLPYRLFSVITNGNNRNAGKNTDSSK